MSRRCSLVTLALASGIALGSATAPVDAQVPVAEATDACPVTSRASSFEPPAPYARLAPDGQFWYGNANLWTRLPVDGQWSGLPRNPNGFRQKVFWWSPTFGGRGRERPSLRVRARRLDGDAPPYVHGQATGAQNDGFGGNGRTMLTGVDVPAEGCWEFSGEYEGHSITFVVAVGS